MITLIKLVHVIDIPGTTPDLRPLESMIKRLKLSVISATATLDCSTYTSRYVLQGGDWTDSFDFDSIGPRSYSVRMFSDFDEYHRVSIREELESIENRLRVMVHTSSRDPVISSEIQSVVQNWYRCW